MLLPHLILALPAVLAPQAASPQEGPGELAVRDILLVHYAGREAIAPDPKDRAIWEALSLLDERLAELPTELPDVPPAVAAIAPLLGHLLDGPGSLRIGFWEGGSVDVDPPLFGQLALDRGSADAAQAFTLELDGILRDAGAPEVPTEDGLRVLPAPVPLSYRSEGSEFRFAAGIADGAEVLPGDAGLPDGVRPAFALSFDYEALLDAAAAMTGEAGEAAEVSQMLSFLGLRSLRMQFAYGTDERAGHAVLRVPDYAAGLSEAGLMPSRSLSAADFARVPADSVWASLGVTNFSGTLGGIEGMLAAMPDSGGVDLVAMIAAQTGFHLEDDLLAHLGETWGAFTSDTTGGGGVLSAVAFVELRNEEALRQTLARMTEIVSQGMAPATSGYVQMRESAAGDLAFTSFTFPGLPIPFEPTLSFAGGYLYFGMHPRAVESAILHVRAGAPGLLDNPHFAAGLGGNAEDLFAATFLDTPRLVRDGYGLATLAGSALRNGTRSPRDPARDAGLVIPPYPVLAQGVLPTVSSTRFEGQDMVTRSHGDRSMAVQLAASLGGLFSTPHGMYASVIGIGVTSSIAIPKLVAARAQANILRSQAQLREAEVEAMLEQLEDTGGGHR